ncbi:hypothetical protein [Desulfosporosinus sp.]|uniref:hypothetical protein n=1 Tax=Desulfosporosinus sp. TaxID=157907 RepID=UPI0023151185|nr:hypothetical protein [Desulfosporosinus sp.]MCO5384408.1 DUF4175 domain-containing protein [Desulfosporosinus sp.]MDA8221767.1 hypothetical protein [Desulfitobacterium hafniense]
MKKFVSKKLTAILGSAVLATGLIAIPAFAGTSNDEGQNLFGQMRSFMASIQSQEIMDSSAMQNLHNSEAMQEVMKTGDIDRMQEAMNSNPEVKALLGEETLNQMNQFMQENGQAMSQMMNGQNATGMNQMMDKFLGQKETL